MIDEPTETPDPRILNRWENAARAGWQAVPDVLLRHQKDLKLTPTELNVLLNVTTHWWRVAEMPFPRASTIAQRMGVEARTVQRALKTLEAKGLIRIERRAERAGRCFDLTPLVRRLDPFARRELQRREAEGAARLHSEAA